MTFLYQGFTHEGNIRSFAFQGIEKSQIAAIFSIEVELPLFARNQIGIQVGPMICLQLLTTASAADPDFVARLHHYRIVEADLRPIIVDREQRAALKAARPAPRKPFRKPSATSQLSHLATAK